jgi:hypothetical protein
MDIKLSKEGKGYKMNVSWYDDMKPIQVKKEIKADTIPKLLQKLQDIISEFYGKDN